jgi:hypothetical protein
MRQNRQFRLLARVSVDVFLRGALRVLRGIHMVAVSQVGVVGSLFVVAFFVMLGRLLVMMRSLLVVLCGFVMMGSCFLRHDLLLRYKFDRAAGLSARGIRPCFTHGLNDCEGPAGILL